MGRKTKYRGHNQTQTIRLPSALVPQVEHFAEILAQPETEIECRDSTGQIFIYTGDGVEVKENRFIEGTELTDPNSYNLNQVMTQSSDLDGDDPDSEYSSVEEIVDSVFDQPIITLPTHLMRVQHQAQELYDAPIAVIDEQTELQPNEADLEIGAVIAEPNVQLEEPKSSISEILEEALPQSRINDSEFFDDELELVEQSNESETLTVAPNEFIEEVEAEVEAEIETEAEVELETPLVEGVLEEGDGRMDEATQPQEPLKAVQPTALEPENFEPALPSHPGEGMSESSEEPVSVEPIPLHESVIPIPVAIELIHETPAPEIDKATESAEEIANKADSKTGIPPLQLEQADDPIVKAAAIAASQEFAEALFNVWQSLASLKNLDCWGTEVEIEAVYQQGFQHLSAFSFLGKLHQIRTLDMPTSSRIQFIGGVGSLYTVGTQKVRAITFNKPLPLNSVSLLPSTPQHSAPMSVGTPPVLNPKVRMPMSVPLTGERLQRPVPESTRTSTADVSDMLRRRTQTQIQPSVTVLQTEEPDNDEELIMVTRQKPSGILSRLRNLIKR